MVRKRDLRLKAPYLKRIWLVRSGSTSSTPIPFACLCFKTAVSNWHFERAVTIIIGENGAGKSTLLEAIAALAGYDDAGGGKGYMPVDHSRKREETGGVLANALRVPKITSGWFFRAESFFTVARYLDEVGSPVADFLSHSHGEGFLRFFEERCQRQGIYIFDEPEAALSPARQIEFLKLLKQMDEFWLLPSRHGHSFANSYGASERGAAPNYQIRAPTGEAKRQPIIFG